MNKTERGRRYSDELKKIALGIYFLGPRCYRQLTKVCFLPSVRTLERYTKRVYLLVYFEFLKLKAIQMDEQDRVCSICVDEMSLKSNLYYNYGTDEVIGLEDNGIKKYYSSR